MFFQVYFCRIRLDYLTYIIGIKTNTGDAKEVEKEYNSQVDELELIKPEIAAAKSDYENIVVKVDEAFETVGDTTKLK